MFTNFGTRLMFGSETGFTLLEVMAAACILTLALGGIYSLYISPIRTLESTQESVLAMQQIRNTYKQLDRDLSNLLLPSLLNPVDFIGTSDSLRFSIMLKEDIVSVDYQVLGYTDTSLIRNSVSIITCDQISFEFYDEKHKIWLSSWDTRSSSDLPSAVKLKFNFATEQGSESLAVVRSIYVGRKMEKSGGLDEQIFSGAAW